MQQLPALPSQIGTQPEEVAVQAVGALLCVYVTEPIFTLVYVRSVYRICESAFETIRKETFRAVLVQARQRPTPSGSSLGTEC